MTAVTVNDITSATLEGTGIFDVLMRANKAHLEAEFSKNRIKGSEYATVYLGSLETVMRSSMEFLVQRQRIDLEAQLLTQQIVLAQVQVQKANVELQALTANLAKIPLEIAQITAQTGLIGAQTANAQAELAIIQANALKVSVEVLHIQAQTAVATQQKLNFVDDLLTATAQRVKLAQETLSVTAQTAVATQQQVNLAAEVLNIPKQGTLMDKQELKVLGDTALVAQQKLNALAENTVITNTGLKVAEEKLFITQKTATEKAQIDGVSVQTNSYLGKQMSVLENQAAGYLRDAEQKATKIAADAYVALSVSEVLTGATSSGISDDTVAGLIAKLTAGV